MKKITIGLHIGHDRSVSIVENGILIGHLAEERIDRIKHSHSVNFPKKALITLMDYLQITFRDVSGVAITYSFVEIEKILPGLAEDFCVEFSLNDMPIYGMHHHEAHAYSTFYTSSFSDSAIFIADGAGDLIKNGSLESESAYDGSLTKIKPIWSRVQQIPSVYNDRRTFFRSTYLPETDHLKQISIARKYEQLTYLIGFGWGQSGKTMGLASYGTPMLSPPKRATNSHDNFDYRMLDLIDEIEFIKEKSGKDFEKFIVDNRNHIAATVQHWTEEIAINMINHVYDLNPKDNLCLAGGLFLNCVLNHKILARSNYKNLHVIPTCGDDGQSVGAAFYAYCQLFGNPKRPKLISPYLGPSYSQEKIKNELDMLNLKYERLDDEILISELANAIEEGNICGILRGRSEAGPRALGHRSIFASATRPLIKNHLNNYVKHRENFRPFAPIVTEEEQFIFFDLINGSPFMLFSTKIFPQFELALPNITHVDGTARVQSISKKGEPFLHKLLEEIKIRTGYPILLNTSFNLSDEPIVETPRHAIATFLRSNIDVLILENFIIRKRR